MSNVKVKCRQLSSIVWFVCIHRALPCLVFKLTHVLPAVVKFMKHGLFSKIALLAILFIALLERNTKICIARPPTNQLKEVPMT